MSDCEKLCWENSERRRRAEEYDSRERLNGLYEDAELRRDTELKRWRKRKRIAKIAGRIHLAASAVLALLGLPMWAAMGLFGAAFYYLCVLEFRVMEGDYV